MKKNEILTASLEDKDALCDMFLEHIGAHPEYISHGEMQMGVGICREENGTFITGLSPMARHYWMKYIEGNITSSYSVVYKSVGPDGELLGFSVAAMQEDNDEPYGMLCDILVKEEARGKGVGSALFAKSISWLKEHDLTGIYLESGLNNHAAHEYFMRRGFCKVSEIYKLMQ